MRMGRSWTWGTARGVVDGAVGSAEPLDLPRHLHAALLQHGRADPGALEEVRPVAHHYFY